VVECFCFGDLAPREPAVVLQAVPREGNKVLLATSTGTLVDEPLLVTVVIYESSRFCELSAGEQFVVVLHVRFYLR
jgi:hypothetical protein